MKQFNLLEIMLNATSGYVENKQISQECYDMMLKGLSEYTKQLHTLLIDSYVFCPYCGYKRDYIVRTDINSGKECKNPLCKAT